MKKIIQLNTHDGSCNYLEKVTRVDGEKVNKCYHLITESPYMRIVGLGNDRIAVDPSGGPMLQEGAYLEEAKATIDKITFYPDYRGYLIYFK